MRVLVTGSSGYIGAVMVPILEAAGHEVVGLDTGLFDGCDHGPAPTSPEHVLARDLRDVTVEDLEGVDAVVHLAALSNDPLGDLDPELTHEINARASVRLAELARDAGVSRFLYSSSCSVYGAADTGDEVDESAPFAPVTAYAESKVAVEGALWDLATDTFSPVAFRNATAYGWSPRLRLDLVLNDFVATAVLTGQVRVLSDGTPWRPLVHVEDISRAFLAGLTAPRDAIHARAFNVGTEGDNHQIRDLARIAAAAVPGAGVEVADSAGPDTRSYRVSFRRIREELPGFEPRWDAEKGAHQLRAAFERHPLTSEDLRTTFRRLPVLAGRIERGTLDGTLRPVQSPALD